MNGGWRLVSRILNGTSISAIPTVSHTPPGALNMEMVIDCYLFGVEISNSGEVPRP